MNLLIFLLAATSMAIFATMGYVKGARWAFISLLILFATLMLIKIFPKQIVMILNGLYTGFMLVINGGMGDLASGDMEAVKEILANVQKPFEDDTTKYAYLLIIGLAVGFTLILAAIMKSKKGIFGLIWGMIYGYLLASAVIPLLSAAPVGLLPFPLLYPAPRQPGQAAAAADTLWTRLAQPATIDALTWVIGGFLVLLLLLTVRQGVKKGKGRREQATGSAAAGKKE